MTRIPGIILALSACFTAAEALTTRSCVPGRTGILSSTGLGASAPEEEDSAQPLNEILLSSPEEMEEYLNNLAAKLSAEIPDAPVKNDQLSLINSWAGDYDKETTRKRLQKQIDEHDVLVFGFSTCPYTVETKELLAAEGVPFVAREFDTLPTPADGYAMRAELASMLSNRTQVPAVFVKQEFVGGLNDGPEGGTYDGLKDLLSREGGLKALLASKDSA